MLYCAIHGMGGDYASLCFWSETHIASVAAVVYPCVEDLWKDDVFAQKSSEGVLIESIESDVYQIEPLGNSKFEKGKQ